MQRDTPFKEGETYHLYNRGAHKQNIFRRKDDYQRFLLLLYLANGTEKVDMRKTLRKYKGQTSADIFKKERPLKSLVDIYAYSLMPNHFHIVLRQKIDRGITIFTRKVLTGYSMYFNLVYDHSGILSQGAVKSRHIDSEAYFRYIFAYIHLNPLSLSLPKWNEKQTIDMASAHNCLHSYKFSSFYDYNIGVRPERAVLAYENAPDFLKKQNDLEALFEWRGEGDPAKV